MIFMITYELGRTESNWLHLKNSHFAPLLFIMLLSARSKRHRGKPKSFPKDDSSKEVHLTCFMGYKVRYLALDWILSANPLLMNHRSNAELVLKILSFFSLRIHDLEIHGKIESNLWLLITAHRRACPTSCARWTVPAPRTTRRRWDLKSQLVPPFLLIWW